MTNKEIMDKWFDDIIIKLNLFNEYVDTPTEVTFVGSKFIIKSIDPEDYWKRG